MFEIKKEIFHTCTCLRSQTHGDVLLPLQYRRTFNGTSAINPININKRPSRRRKTVLTGSEFQQVALWSPVFHVSVSGSKLVMFYVSLDWGVLLQPHRLECSEVNSDILSLCKGENEPRQICSISQTTDCIVKYA